MQQGFQFADIIFLAIVAGFILYRLIQTFGKSSGLDPSDQIKKAMREHEERVISLSARQKQKTEGSQASSKEEDLSLITGEHSKAAAGLTAISGADPTFSPSGFLQGARVLFEWVVEDFSKGNKTRLKRFLSEAIYGEFADEIDRRIQAKRKHEVTLVAIPKAEIIDAKLKGNEAVITVQFQSEQIHVVRDEKGEIVEGNPSDVETILDEWTFARDLQSRSPDWKITQT